RLGSHRALTAIRSSPVSMAGDPSLCIEERILPLNGAHVSHERFDFRWPLPHVVGSPDLGVLSASLTSARSSGPPHLAACRTLQASLEPDGSPLFPCNPLAACRRYEPRKHPDDTRLLRIPGYCLLHREIRSAASTTIDFGAIFPFTAVPAYCLPVYASQWPLPNTTQDSVRGCWLSFPAAPIPG